MSTHNHDDHQHHQQKNEESVRKDLKTVALLFLFGARISKTETYNWLDYMTWIGLLKFHEIWEYIKSSKFKTSFNQFVLLWYIFSLYRNFFLKRTVVGQPKWNSNDVDVVDYNVVRR